MVAAVVGGSADVAHLAVRRYGGVVRLCQLGTTLVGVAICDDTVGYVGVEIIAVKDAAWRVARRTKIYLLHSTKLNLGYSVGLLRKVRRKPHSLSKPLAI